MIRIKVNQYKDTHYFIWDNKEETIQKVNEYLKVVKGDNWECIRCWDEKTQSNTSDTLCISEDCGDGMSNSFYYLGEYVIDSGRSFWGYSEKEFNDGKWIEAISRTI